MFNTYVKYDEDLREFDFKDFIFAPKNLASYENKKEIINMIKEAIMLERTGLSLPAGSLKDQDYAWLYRIKMDNNVGLTLFLSTKELKKDDPEVISKIKQVIDSKYNPNVPKDLLETQNYFLEPVKFVFYMSKGVFFILEEQEYKTNNYRV